ncbi:MAG: glucose-1-phosphate thymidylyltransferase [Nitrososphaerota archaeon]|nr:glucose-1-phosphate thymidylyltransferase [Nitrososphaerota archaeon]
MKGLVLAGGHGTRLRPLTYGFAKQLIPVANKPVLFYALEDLQKSGITDVVLNVAPHSKDDVIAAVGNGAKFGIKVRYSLQESPLGIAHAVKNAETLIGDEPFVVYLGDNILKDGIERYVRRFLDSKLDALALVSKVEHPERFGTVEVAGDRVVKLVEKPKVPTSNLAMVGVYILRPSVFESVRRLKPSWRGELEIVDAYQDMVDRGMRVEAAEIEGWWADTGSTEDLLTANKLVLDQLDGKQQRSSGSSGVEGAVSIGKGTQIGRNTTIKGPVIIGDSSVIGPDTHLGPYSSIGNNVEILSTEVENSIIMDGTKIHGAGRITDSLIGRDVQIRGITPTRSGRKFVLGQRSLIQL